MNDIVVLTLPLALIMTGAIAVLHIASAVIDTLPLGALIKKIACITLAVINAATHLALIAYTLIKDVPTEELLCLLMLSAAVGTVSIGIAEKRKKTEKEEV